MEPLRIVFMGTPDFAVPTLNALINGPHEVVGVFCQPDKQKGRGQKVQMCPVKEVALAHNINVYQPLTLRDETAQSLIAELQPQLVVVVAYGKILPPWLIAYPEYGCMNVHASLLPKYRGAAPIQFSILNGDTETGVTIMQMDDGLDTGHMLEVTKTPIEPLETSGQLFDRLAQLGGSRINEVIAGVISGEITPVPQNDEEATYTTKITKDMGRIDWQLDAKILSNKTRGLNPAPGCYTFVNGKRLKVWLARPYEADKSLHGPIGTVVAVLDNSFVVATGEGLLEILEVQPENKKRMVAGDFCRGHQVKVGLSFNE
ncbi:methionyl-tRNA formyltransferase [uncultured Veillonella sp.]|uniref:methionyl-tRNA formyltransferase n=1 Tax=uncultured Veillonella sp. TaxID=159268 RepID=UPI0025EFB095|nr:methionyl-tRNA formyltransferase [uncultured Veillonella sp.]MDY3973040.1 methionyl-tRNA formyltransferase [Veillonella caviae]